MYRLIRTFLIFTSLLSFASSVKGQELDEELVKLELPPIEILFESARNSAMVEFYNLRQEGEELVLKTERRRWLSYISIQGSYQYGIMGINSYYDGGIEMAPVYQYTVNDQLWYNIGATMRVPLDQVFDRKNRIRRQKLKIDETLKERDLWHDEQKMKIVEQYAKAKQMFNVLRFVYDLVIETQSYYEIAQKDFIAGRGTSQELSVARGQLSQSKVQLENVKAELTIALYKLEILSNYKIMN